MAEAAVQFFLETLSSMMSSEIRLILGVDDEMEKLRSILTTIQAVLEDAELKQTESIPIRDWLRKINLLVYEIDDILDDCNTQCSKMNHSASNIPKCCRIQEIPYRHNIGKRMKQVTKKLEDVAAERSMFHLREMQPVHCQRNDSAPSRETTGFPSNMPVYGRDEDRDEIVKMLVDDASENQHLSVLPIIGLGGLGKTTLTNQVFNDPRVVEHFEKRIWVSVSDNFDVKTLLNQMIASATGSEKMQLRHLDTLLHRLRELLSQKRYLVVLDDVWNDQQQKWFELKNILSCGSTGASIIVTTRVISVAKIMGTLRAYELKGLSEDHCWTLLRQYAFGQEEEVNPELQLIGNEIVKKCAGAPLAAMALGGILRFKRTEKEWMHVRESEIWQLPPESSILPVLKLSYHHLPMELRQCFAYFAAFPKDHKVGKKELIRLWMAHGFISAKGALQVEDVGNEICKELILRSLVQPHRDGERWLSMHDLVHDLAESVMQHKVPGIQSNIRSGASTIRQVHLGEKKILFPKSDLQENMKFSSIFQLKSLRVLDASYTSLRVLPHSIRNLKHLRYLNLSHSKIVTLPNSLCNLWNLRILNLNRCKELKALPKDMRYLKNLEHLCLKNCWSLSEMPSKMRELSNLKTLNRFVVGQNKNNQLEELQCLNLSGSLHIGNLGRVKDHLDAKKANIIGKKNLRNLSLEWEVECLAESGDEDVHEKVLEALKPHPNLEKLQIWGFRGRSFPVWMTNSTLGKVVEIDISDCMNCKRLPKLGELPHLKSLRLSDLGVEYIIEEEEEEEVGSGNPVKKMQFLALENLVLVDLPNLKGVSKERIGTESFQNFQLLIIKHCSSLILPPLSSFKKLNHLICSSSSLAQLSEVDGITSLDVNIEEKMGCFLTETLIKFTNLQELSINDADEISVMGEGLQALSKLQSLTIEKCKIRCIPEGMLRHLNALNYLRIVDCPEFQDLPDEIKYLHNLEYLYFEKLPKMACLPKALQHLSSQTVLTLMSLPKLKSLPDWFHRLTSLHLEDCKRVESLPAAIPNLKYLTIWRCPKLARRCKRGSGEEWHKIAHIPNRNID